MVATLSKSGTGSYRTGNSRSYDAWGVIRTGGSAAGDPKGRYCASLGHKQDDESGQVYMRAPYFEPTSDRCVSEDFARSGENWFCCAKNDPINRADRGGRDAVDWLLFVPAGTWAIGGLLQQDSVAVTAGIVLAVATLIKAIRDGAENVLVLAPVDPQTRQYNLESTKDMGSTELLLTQLRLKRVKWKGF